MDRGPELSAPGGPSARDELVSAQGRFVVGGRDGAAALCARSRRDDAVALLLDGDVRRQILPGHLGRWLPEEVLRVRVLGGALRPKVMAHEVRLRPGQELPAQDWPE